ncbi:phosphopantetheine-binding protein [Streptomyces sp. NBC_00503]|uniref:phosphopantetheine-binding protein n=1 Tax=Streptomyces sp. NBC_00503 TaxID=2903659 RepID=UPI002E81B583|nr:phosphopantetheine-binding protein [Streptomyces sp. NBC_00503]WUD86587.1 phosphopantetheine-binding protein [Streptomyces sp. NBC_00503]
MTIDQSGPSRTMPPTAPADVLRDLSRVLGDVLRIQPEKIDPEQTFYTLGLDSLLTVEFVAVINARYGTRALPTDLHEHPTPAEFAQQIARELGQGGAGVMAPPPAAAPMVVRGDITEVLREQLAGILCCDVWDIDPATAFDRLGLDSILGAEFIAVINRTFGLSERAVSLYDHPDIAALAAYIAARTGVVADAPLPRNPELDVLLDAVREERLTVDQAVVLLARRG